MTPLPAFIQGLNQKANMETESCSCHHQHGDFVLTPILGAGMTNLKLKKPSCMHMSSAMTMYTLVVVSDFLITREIIYYVIVELLSVGSMTEEHGIRDQ